MYRNAVHMDFGSFVRDLVSNIAVTTQFVLVVFYFALFKQNYWLGFSW